MSYKFDLPVCQFHHTPSHLPNVFGSYTTLVLFRQLLFMSGSDYSDTPYQRCESNRSLEDPARYQPGGYHPIAIGDELHDGRYRVIHRISHGAYSTVWMAMDQRPPSSADGGVARARYVAVKIGTARYDTREASLLRRLHDNPKSQSRGWFSRLSSLDLAAGDTAHDMSRFVVAILDEFDIHGPNGTHHCLVTELLGPSIDAVMDCWAIEGWGRLPTEIVRRTAVQCAEALVSLHSQGIVHAGTLYRKHCSRIDCMSFPSLLPYNGVLQSISCTKAIN
jgi:hypothetical protein